MRIGLVFLVGICLVVSVVYDPRPVRGARPALPAPVCALVIAQVVCYDVERATPHPITPPDQQVIDFAIAPDGNWIVYRAANTIRIAAMSGNAATQQVDTQATPSAELDLSMTTIAWSPDGLAIAYVTASGFRVAFPTPEGNARFVDVGDRSVVNLRFSPSGTRLAAQADDGSWTVFAVQTAGEGTGEPTGLKRTRTIDQAADVAWLDDSALVVAMVAGGLSRLDAANADQPPAWTVPDEHFVKLFATSDGEVLALHPDPGDTIGSVVAISADGQVVPLGSSKIDEQAEWGPDGAMLFYITSGTPILINRATGAEDLLPLKRVTGLKWAAPPPTLVSSLPLDADVYFLAPDDVGIRQVWRLPRGGLDAATPVTHQPVHVAGFAVSRDGSQVVLETDSGPVAVSLSGTPIPADAGIPPVSTPDLHGVSLSASGDAPQREWLIRLSSGGSSRVLVRSLWPIVDVLVAAKPNGLSVFFLRHVGWNSGPDTIQLGVPSNDPMQPEARSRFAILSGARLSPTGRFAAGLQRAGRADQLVILDLSSGRKVRIQGADGVSLFKWVS